MANNKIIFGDRVLIDLTDATITGESEASKILKDYTAYGADGTKVTGTCEFDVDSSEATANQAEVLNGKTFAKGGAVLEGTMPNIGAQESSIATKDQEVSISQGYHDGSGKVSIDDTEKQKLVAENIKNGVEVLGVLGTYTGSELIKATPLETEAYTTEHIVLPSQEGDFDYFTQVKVAPIYYDEIDNAAGGKTITIGKVAPTI